MAMMLLVVGVLGAGAILFTKRCEFLGICDGEQAPLPPPPAPAEEGEDENNEEDGSDVNNVVINNPTQVVPYPIGYPVYPSYPRRPPVIVKPVPVPSCPSRINRHGRTYYLTSLSRMPDAMIMIFPPPFLKEGRCIYQLADSPRPQPPVPVERTQDCCRCKTTGYDGEVKCSSDGGNKWSVNPRYRYDINKSLSECAKICKHIPPKYPPVPDRDNDYECNDGYCKRYPSKCPRCSKKGFPWGGIDIDIGIGGKANYGALQTNRMSFL